MTTPQPERVSAKFPLARALVEDHFVCAVNPEVLAREDLDGDRSCGREGGGVVHLGRP